MHPVACHGHDCDIPYGLKVDPSELEPKPVPREALLGRIAGLPGDVGGVRVAPWGRYWAVGLGEAVSPGHDLNRRAEDATNGEINPVYKQGDQPHACASLIL